MKKQPYLQIFEGVRGIEFYYHLECDLEYRLSPSLTLPTPFPVI